MEKVFSLILVLMLCSACRVNPAITDTLTPVFRETESPKPSPIRPSPSPSSTFTTTPPPPTHTLLPSLEPSRTPSVEKFRNLPYVPDGSTKQTLDIYLPTASEDPFPVLLTIHGGGGDKADFSSLAMRFAKRGYAVVSINFRDTPKDSYPTAVQDAFCALAWMYTNAAEYNLDPNRFFALGHSSGGTLAAMLGTVDTPAFFMESCPDFLPGGAWIRGIVTFTGIFEYASAANYSAGLKSYIDSYLGAGQEAAPAIWEQASPISWVDGSDPPFLVIHGEADDNIDPHQSIIFTEALEAATVDVQLLLIPGLDHRGIVWSESALEAVEKFLDELASP